MKVIIITGFCAVLFSAIAMLIVNSDRKVEACAGLVLQSHNGFVCTSEQKKTNDNR